MNWCKKLTPGKWIRILPPMASTGIEPVWPAKFVRHRMLSYDELKKRMDDCPDIKAYAGWLTEALMSVKYTGIYDADANRKKVTDDEGEATPTQPGPSLTFNPVPYPRATSRQLVKGNRCYLCSLQAQVEIELSAASRFMVCLPCVSQQFDLVLDEVGNGHFRQRTPGDR